MTDVLHFGSLSLPLAEVAQERTRQDTRWGEQNHPDGPKPAGAWRNANWQRDLADNANEEGRLNWQHILREEVAEAFEAIGDAPHLHEELVQVAAVAVAWVEAIDRRAVPA